MALNLNSLKKADKELNSRGGSDLFLSGKDIGEETFVRILPPLPELNGIYFVEQIGYWINKNFYVSPATFGLPCPIEERIEEMEASLAKKKDKELQDLVEKINKKSVFLIPILHVDYEMDNDDEIESVVVIGNKPKVLQSGPMLMKAINKVVLSPKLARKLKKVDDGITDRVEGYNLVLSKTGQKLDTEYTAYEDEQFEMEAKYYEKIPSVLNLTKKKIYTDDYLNAILDWYFEGDTKPSDDEKISRYKDELDSDSSEDSDKEEKPRRRRRRSSEKDEEKPKKESTKDEDEDDVEEKPKTRRRRRRSDDEDSQDKEDSSKDDSKDSEDDSEKEEKPRRRRRRKSEEEDDSKDEDKEEPSSSLLDELEDLDD